MLQVLYILHWVFGSKINGNPAAHFGREEIKLLLFCITIFLPQNVVAVAAKGKYVVGQDSSCQRVTTVMVEAFLFNR